MGQDYNAYPLTFEPELKDKIWGGRRLETLLDKALPPDLPIGESWEVHGGSVIESGEWAGRTLDKAWEELGERLLGTNVELDAGDDFPLLFKYIDASDVLSVQVHPDDTYAQQLEQYPYGKTEAWYVIHAEPGAKLVHGWKRPTSRAEVETAVRESRLEDLLNYVEVRPGDVVFVPAGTVHAIGGGIVLGEIQENSDITYRLYDWGRVGFDGKPRDLHVESSLDVLDYGLTDRPPIPAARKVRPGVDVRLLTRCAYFGLELIEGREALRMSPSESSFVLLSCLEGPVSIKWDDGLLTLRKGRTALLPAVFGPWRLAADQDYKLLYMYVPTTEEAASDQTKLASQLVG